MIRTREAGLHDDLLAYYARRAAEYDAVYAKPERQADLARVRAWVRRALAGHRVLEVACGTGYWTEVLAPVVADLVATDLADEPLAVARTRPSPPGRVRFARADAYRLDAVPGAFTAAFAGFWWSHVPHARVHAFVDGLHRRLGPGGTVVLLDNRYVPGSSTPVSRRDADGDTFQQRLLADGSRHEILKNFPDTARLLADLAPPASDVELLELEYYWAARYRIATPLTAFPGRAPGIAGADPRGDAPSRTHPVRAVVPPDTRDPDRMDARAALARLREGNRRFADDLRRHAHSVTRERRAEVAAGQQPFAIVLGCSDSRVPAELVFDQGLGDLFVIRVAGNIVAPSQVGSVEFAAELFGTRLVVVLGHSQCGAVTATLEDLRRPGGERSRNVRAIVDRIRPAVEPLLATPLAADPATLAREAVRANVRAAANHLRYGSEILERLAERDGLLVVGGEYSLEAGTVDFFDGVPD